MTITTDLHMHSTFSPDGRSSIKQLCERALELEFSAIAVTEHVEWLTNWGNFDNANAYLAEVAACRAQFANDGLAVYSGAELGNPHWFSAESTQFLSQHQFDIVIGSVHWLYHEHNIQNSSVFKKRDPYNVICDYFDEATAMVQQAEFDFLAHIDRIWWQAQRKGASVKPQDLEGKIRATFSACAERNVLLELNTKHIADRQNWNDVVITLLEWYRDAGGAEIVVNSDAHHTREMGRNFDVAERLLAEVNLVAATPASIIKKSRDVGKLS